MANFTALGMRPHPPHPMPYTSGAQTVARKALWSGPRSNYHWKENLTL